ncbi:MAG: DUF1570 domain-containing protein [Tepidisphaeraceae bacterium]
MPARAWLILWLIGCVAAAPTPRPGVGHSRLKAYDGRYYRIHTDLTGDDLREAELRMTRMAEEYHERTRDFSGAVNSKFPFFLYRNPADYYRAGGQRDSAGFFDRRTNTLVAIAGKQTSDYTWSVVQHEGFHQFAANVIGGELPIWVNEGLAEYFGDGVFTGDGFVTGVIPPERLKRVKQQLAAKSFWPIKEMMLLAHRDWNDQLTLANYDQAWSMVQFLAHAENGRYAGAFVAFMRAIGGGDAGGQPWPQAWLANFGSAEGFEQRWRDYWMKLPDDATSELYARATVETLTSVLARATLAKQKFADFDAFAIAAANKSIPFDDRTWLPPKLTAGALEQAGKMREKGAVFALIPAVGGKPAAISCTLRDGKKLVGRFVLKEGAVEEVKVEMPRR